MKNNDQDGIDQDGIDGEGVSRTPLGPQDDQRLTAYALGELDGQEVAQVEARLANDPMARAHVEQLRSLGLNLEREFAALPDPAPLTPEQRRNIVAAAGVPETEPNTPRGRLLGSPWYRRDGFRRAAAVAALALGVGVVGYLVQERSTPIAPGESSTLTGRLAPSDSPRHLESMGYGAGGDRAQGTDDWGLNPTAEATAEGHQALGDERLGSRLLRAEEEAPEPPSDKEQGDEASQLAGLYDDASRTYRGPGDGVPPGAPATSGAAGGRTVNLVTHPISGDGSPGLTTATGTDGFSLGLGAKRERAKGGVEDRYDFPPAETPAPGLPRRAQAGGEAYDKLPENPFTPVAQDPLSTFSIDVDTASYSNVRRFLRQGQLPPPEAIRIEEMINYFSYDYPGPSDETPFAVHAEIIASPWSAGHKLLRIGLQGRLPGRGEPLGRNLVFLVDVSGSMSGQDKLPLVQRSLEMLVGALRPADTIGLVTYAGRSGIALRPTPVSEKEIVLSAIRSLNSGGSTNGAAGILDAYRLAQAHFIEGGVNRVILATDGDFNIGLSDRAGLEQLIAQKRASGVFLSVLGFGQGNLKDSQMEALADKGNGNYAYIDSIREARKVLVRDLDGTLETIAKDVKLQLEFNPARIHSFRLIGYGNRVLAHRDFDDDRKDAGEIGAGHSVTALYELVPVGVELAGTRPLRYRGAELPAHPIDGEHGDEALFVALRYKLPDAEESTLLEVPVFDADTPFEEGSTSTRFAAAVASFGMQLRQSRHAGATGFEAVRAWAAAALGADPHGDRREFLTLVDWAIQASLGAEGMGR